MGIKFNQSITENILILTKAEKVINWSRATSVWPMTFGLACCAIEMMAAGASRFDIDRFGCGIFRATPRQSDLMIVAGAVTYKMAPLVRRLYDQMLEPKWVLALGNCSISGGPFDTYHTIQGVDKIIPVDVYIPGCPPRPESLIYGFMKLQDKILSSSITDKYIKQYTKQHSIPKNQSCKTQIAINKTDQLKPNAMNKIPLPSLKLWQKSINTITSNNILNNFDMSFPIPKQATSSDAIQLQVLLSSRIEEIFEQSGDITCQVSKQHILEVLQICRDNGYEMLVDQTGTHYPTAKDFRFSLVYHLVNIEHKKRLRIRILIPEAFEVESATAIYPTANWLEREIFDMLGINFKNHPKISRILCPDNWEGHPLRKDYPLRGLGQRNILENYIYMTNS